MCVDCIDLCMDCVVYYMFLNGVVWCVNGGLVGVLDMFIVICVCLCWCWGQGLIEFVLLCVGFEWCIVVVDCCDFVQIVCKKCVD